MDSKIVEVIEDFMAVALNKENPNDITEQIIKDKLIYVLEMIKSMYSIESIDPSDIDLAIINIESRYSITMDKGSLLKEDNYKKWYFNSKADRGTAYWERYRRYLENDVKLPVSVINSIDDSSEEIMDVIGDPLSDTSFQRRGLVIGSVQSGKTSNYTALINKAADSGYKVIILLTGTIEKLRQQTQGRIDEGFVGMDSRDILKKPSIKKNHLGVGKYSSKDKNLKILSLTTINKDFDSKNLNLSIDSANRSLLFVIKKNKSILEKLYEWLKQKNSDPSTEKINAPMLIIDDEADNASINTNNPDKDPTAINNEIRKMLKLFYKYSYIGFTATPFANIFIDPQLNNTQKDNLDDLFPKDFIYLLEQPSNYVGPLEMYNSGDKDTPPGEYNYMIRYNDDMEDYLELKHKNNSDLYELPPSLKSAILLFLLSNAVRDLRGQEKKHRSMLIHVSRFISVQKNVQREVNNYLKMVRDKVKNYILTESKDPIIEEMRLLFEMEYGKQDSLVYNDEFSYKKVSISEPWEEVKKILYKSISPIQVHTVNSRSASQRMNYDEHENGLRLIAVGGLSLARGLTLEGLTISYFYRNTKMYDTLMQMGRWFGYREGYVDLCRLWTSKESAGWYEHIAKATEELRNEIKIMSRENRKPIDFGLRVRSATDTPLIITARNKMKHSEQITLVRQLNGRMIETAIIPSKKEDLDANKELIERWLISNKVFFETNNNTLGKDKPTFKNVPKENIVNLLSLLEFPHMNEFSSDKIFVDEIVKSNSKVFNEWDVVIATNILKKNEIPKFLGDIPISPLSRSFDLFGSGNYIRISKSKRRLGNTEYALAGLENSKMQQIKEEVTLSLQGKKNKKGNQKSPTENMYFNTGIDRNPLIVIYPIQLIMNSHEKSKQNKNYSSLLNQVVIGISIGVPDIKGVQSTTYEYVVNKVYQRELIEGSSNTADWDFEYDDEEDGDNIF